MGEESQEEFRRGYFSTWEGGIGEAVRTTPKIIKVGMLLILVTMLLTFPQYGLYDRPELQSWHKGRVVLLGDAAHPTSPVCTSLLFMSCRLMHIH